MKIKISDFNDLLFKYLKKQIPIIVILFFSLLLYTLFRLMSPHILKLFIDRIKESYEFSSLVRIGVIFNINSFLIILMKLIITFFSNKISWLSTNMMRNDLFTHCINLDLSFHNQFTPGELIERIDSDITIISKFFSSFVTELSINALFMIGIIFIFLYTNIYVGIVFILFALVCFFLTFKFKDFAIPVIKDLSQKRADFYGFLEERIGGIDDIRTSKSVNYVMFNFMKLLKNWYDKQVKSGFYFTLIISSGFFMIALSNILAIICGYVLYKSNQITLGTVYLLIHVANLLVYPMHIITNQFGMLQRVGAVILRTKELLNIKSNLIDKQQNDIVSFDQSIYFEDVNFKYEEKYVLKNISFSLEPGKTLGIIGKTGSGKTSLIRLLYRFYDVSSGKLKIGNKNIKDIPLTILQNNIGLVTQNMKLFAGTLRDNITYFKKDLPDEKILNVLYRLGLEKWLAKKKDGLDTQILGKFSGISAGEEQIIAISRIFLHKNPSIIIFDEATSKMDAVTEKLVNNLIIKIFKNYTVLIIAHRLTSIKMVDYVMVLDKGKIVEYEKRTELEKDSSSNYFKLINENLMDYLV